jgi:DNA-directed RNA polymerase subunit L
MFSCNSKMELKILDDKKHKLIFELKGVGHTFCNALKSELWNDKHVKIATYSIRHPQISSPQIVVETDNDSDPRSVLNSAVQRMHKVNEKFRKDFSKEVR